jgi:pyruvate dehydrogenase E2 component (dihydrolipoamide acetyltransferase)
MAHAIVVPRLGWSMEEGTFVRWLKRDGDVVRRGEALFELEGDKALQEVEAIDDGILRIPLDAPEPGSDVTVGTILGFLVREGEPTPSITGATGRQSNAAHDAASDSAIAVERGYDRNFGAGAMSSSPAAERGIRITPRARRIAIELGIDWTRLTGSGAGGRIRERDVRAAADADTRH